MESPQELTVSVLCDALSLMAEAPLDDALCLNSYDSVGRVRSSWDRFRAAEERIAAILREAGARGVPGGVFARSAEAARAW